MKKSGKKSNVIYGYYSKVHNKIMYVGQTKNLEGRHRQHLLYEPYRKDQSHSGYPLSLGIKKYGVDNYELRVLEEDIDSYKLNEREKYWISYYNTYNNGYNQTKGGQDTQFLIYSEETVQKIIHLLKDTNMTMTEIKELTGISLTHIWNINTGKRRKQDNLSYPLRDSTFKGTKGLQLSPVEVDEIIYVIKNTNLTMKEISDKFSVSTHVIKGINNGTTIAYRKENYLYPIRNFTNYFVTNEVACEIISAIRNESSMTLKQISENFNVPSSVVVAINNGKSHKQSNESYPIRKPNKFYIEDKVLENIQKDLIDKTLSYDDISKKYNLDKQKISRINTGRLLKKQGLRYPLRINKKINNIRKHL